MYNIGQGQKQRQGFFKRGERMSICLQQLRGEKAAWPAAVAAAASPVRMTASTLEAEPVAKGEGKD